MAFTMKQMAIIVATLGLLSFVFGVIAENKKPTSVSATTITGKDVTVCKYKSDPYVALGYLSFLFLVGCTVVGYWSLIYPYQGRSIPQFALFQNTRFLVFFNIAIGLAGLAAALTLWPVITEQLHWVNNVHQGTDYTCPTAKTGLIGGGAFVSLDAALFWLVSLMLASNTREDYFEEVDGSGKGGAGVDSFDVAVPMKGVA